MESLYKEIRGLNPRNHNICVTLIPWETRDASLSPRAGGAIGEKEMSLGIRDRREEKLPSDYRNLGENEMGTQKVLIVDGDVRVGSEELKCWIDEHISEFVNLTGAGILDIDGSRFYYEQLSGPKKLVICGSGHVGLAVIRQGKLLNYHVTVIDDREEFRAKAIEAGADEVKIGPVARELEEIPGDPDTCFVIATRAHLNDLESLKCILKKEYAYVGIMGSRRKTIMLEENLKEEGYPEEDIRQIHMPIGLRIGAETPAEIAVAVLAEIIKVCSGQAKRFGYPEDVLQALCELEESGAPLILATVIRKKGAAPRGVGSKLLLYPDGRMKGTVGGGKVEALTIKEARDMFERKDSRSRIIGVNMDAALEEAGAMICGGRMEVLLEVIGKYHDIS